MNLFYLLIIYMLKFIIIIIIFIIINYIIHQYVKSKFNNLLFIEKNDNDYYHINNYNINVNNYKLLNFSGSGYKGIAFVYILKTQVFKDYLNNNNLDIFSKFDGFSGISSGSFIAACICGRKIIIKKIINTPLFNSILKYFNYNNINNIIDDINNDIFINYSKIILDIIIYSYKFDAVNLFLISYKYVIYNKFSIFKLPNINKYPENILKQYLDFSYDELDQDLFISATEIKTNKLITFTNHNYNEVNYKVYETVLMSGSIGIPPLNQYKGYIDGGYIVSNNLLNVISILKQNSNIYPKLIINNDIINYNNINNNNNNNNNNNLFFKTGIKFIYNLFNLKTPFLLKKNNINILKIIKSYNKNIKMINIYPFLNNKKKINLIDFRQFNKFIESGINYKLNEYDKNIIDNELFKDY